MLQLSVVVAFAFVFRRRELGFADEWLVDEERDVLADLRECGGFAVGRRGGAALAGRRPIFVVGFCGRRFALERVCLSSCGRGTVLVDRFVLLLRCLLRVGNGLGLRLVGAGGILVLKKVEVVVVVILDGAEEGKLLWVFGCEPSC